MKKLIVLLLISSLCAFFAISLSGCDLIKDYIGKEDGENSSTDNGSTDNGEINNGNNSDNSGGDAEEDTLFLYELSADGTYYTVIGIDDLKNADVITSQALDITIPDTYKDLPVKKIGSYAFSGRQYIKSVSIGNNITDIGKGAFVNVGFEKLVIPDSVTNIGEAAFSACHDLKEILLGDGIEVIPGSAFSSCTALERVNFGNNVIKIEISAFSWCSSLESITFGNSVQKISDSAFLCCSSLKNVVLGDNINDIDQFAFENCEALVYNEYDNAYYLGTENNPYYALIRAKDENITSCEINASTKLIAQRAFFGINYMENITLPNGLAYICDEAFLNCWSLSNIHIPDSVEKIGDSALRGCRFNSISVDENNKNYKAIDGNLYSKDGKKIIQYALAKEDETFKIPYGVTEIGHGAFASSENLYSIEIPSSVTVIGPEAFYYDANIQAIELPYSVTEIGKDAFSYCRNLRNIFVDKDNSAYKDIDGNLYSKDGKTFIQYALNKPETDFVVPDGVVTVCESAFNNCENLCSIKFPDSVITLEKDFIFACSNLKTIEIGAGVTEIIYNLGGLFRYCYSIENIIVSPDNANYKSINGALYSKDGTVLIRYANAKADTYFAIPDVVTTVADNAFFNNIFLECVYIPSSVTYIAYEAFCDMYELKSVIISAKYLTIYYSFDECYDLDSVYFVGTEKEWQGVNIVGNDDLRNATIYYYTESEPEESGNFWCYMNGVPFVW